MSKNHRHMTARNALRRGAAALLCIVMLFGLLPGMELSARADDSWAAPYLDQLAGWGVMRGDINGNLHPERNITRAEFVTMMNRAYGYDEMGGNPFSDVFPSDWYYDDIDIAYNVGYFNGTSDNTASPNAELTREQAAVLLARNMMLQGASGETLGFTDSRELSDWSRGLIGAVAKTGVVNGYGDGSFRPKNNITRGEVAAMLSRAVGTLVNQPGSESLGSVYGNLTVNSSGVSLRNTTVVGNLYLTGGIGLGDVLLENVDVYGEIIVAGAGEANSANSSVVMRNVTANDLIVDNISNQFVTVRAEGDTRIAKTSVRTNAYVEDTTPNGYGLSYIELDGEQGTRLQLAGNVKEVKNLTPMSSLEIVQGSAGKVTSDEHATGSAVRIETGARVDELNLDVGASVSGDGDIGAMNVGAAGTNVNILPDNITVRPGITSNITGTAMNNVTAAESSADPRLLSGYPAVRNVAPNSATLAFATNKAGTVYWAVSALADGSVSEDDLITNPAYGGNILRSGRINAASSKTEYTAQVSGLTIDGSYYVSAILVDSRGNHSPLKVTAFSTPDNTTPAFTTGYPTITRNTTKTAQVTVMTNKSCQLYYALMPRGSSTPTAQEFKSGAVSGNLGYGVVDVVKNNTQPVNVNSIQLEEQTNYTLYLWLNDYDNARSSGVRSLNFTTPDETPPVVTDIMQTDSKAAAVDVTYTLNEPGTLYWSIVAEGNDTFMNYELNTTEAKVKTEAGYGALKKGSSSTSKADTAVRMAISGLNARTTGTTSYDVYYIAKDRAGNYAESVGRINVRTLDADAPTVTQEFTEYNDDNKNEPLANTDIRLVFSESVQGGSKGEKLFLSLYADVTSAVGPEAQAKARENLANALREHITMYRVPASGRPTAVKERTKENQADADLDWTIDYRFATVGMEEGKMVVTFPTRTETAKDPRSALDLDSGGTYYFRLEGIYDNALNPNAMGVKELPQFRTVFARVSLTPGENYELDKEDKVFNTVESSPDNEATRMDFNFVMDPMSVDRVADDMRWDMLIWTDTTLSFTLYRRVNGGAWEKVTPDSNGKNNPTTISVTGEQDGFAYVSLTKVIENENKQDTDFPKLKEMLKTEYAIHIDTIVDSTNYTAWNHNVTFKVSVVAGTRFELNSLATGSYKSNYDAAINDGVVSINTPDPFQRRIPFTDSKPPKIIAGYPRMASLGDLGAQINVMLDRPGQVYYIVFPLSQLKAGSTAIDNQTTGLTEDLVKKVDSFASSVGVKNGTLSGNTNTSLNGPITGDPPLNKVPRVGETTEGKYTPELPTVNTVTIGRFTPDVIKGSTTNVAANVAAVIDLNGKLTPNTVYMVCLVTRGTSAVFSDDVLCYRFTTLEAVRPTINVSATGGVVSVNVDKRTNLTYFLAQNSKEGQQFQEFFQHHTSDPDWATVSTDDKKGFFSDNSSGGTHQYREEAGGLSFSSTKELTAMTVVDAMATPCNRGTQYVGSVFDMYASTEAKNTYASLIRSSSISGNEIVMTDSGTFTPENNDKKGNKIDCNSSLQPRVLYTFMSVGKSSDGSGDAFRAYYSVSGGDTTSPMVTGVFYDGAEITQGKFPKDSKLIVTFSEPLYALVSTGTNPPTQDVYPLDTCGSSVHSNIRGGYFAMGAAINLAVGATMETAATHPASSKSVTSITFDLAENASTAMIAFRPGMLCDQSRNGVGRDKFTIEVSIKKTGDGETAVYEPVVTVTKAWNSTSWGNN